MPVALQDFKEVKHEVNDSGVRRCVRCVMPENYPGVTLDAEGTCNYCRTFDAQWGHWMTSLEAQAASEAELRSIFQAAKSKHKRYDALLGISGGKDSSYALHLCRAVYGLNVLTFTKDGGFLSDVARERIEKLVSRYHAPHVYCHDPLFLNLAGIFTRKTGNFCAPCELSTFNLSAMMAREYDVPLLILGTSSRTEAGAPKALNPWDPWYFNKVMKNEPFRERISCSCYGHNYIVKESIARLQGKRNIVLLPDYVPWDEDGIRVFFKRELGFDFGGEHTDCWATGIAEYLYRKKMNGNTPEVGKMSLLVRTGKITRQDALEELRADDKDKQPPQLDRFLQVTGLTQHEFEAAAQKSPAPYLGGISKMFNTLRKRIRRQAG
jgi:hypothetical protein